MTMKESTNVLHFVNQEPLDIKLSASSIVSDQAQELPSNEQQLTKQEQPFLKEPESHLPEIGTSLTKTNFQPVS